MNIFANHTPRLGTLPSILVDAETLAEGWHGAMVGCYRYGARIETPKHREGMTLGYDADITVRVEKPLMEPAMHRYGLYDDPRGVMQYILEVTHGIHNHWKKQPGDKDSPYWGYTYNERFSPQMPHVLKRILADWEEKQRITGRDYQFTIWRPDEDIILEQEDPPCWQRGQLRFVKNEDKELCLNYITDWRSRDLAKAWLENAISQVELQHMLAKKISDMIGEFVQCGAYIDRSSSLHIYGKYIDDDGMEGMLDKMVKASATKSKGALKPSGDLSKLTMNLGVYMGDRKELKRIVAAQMHAEKHYHGKNLSEGNLRDAGYIIDTFRYPREWDKWPEAWENK